MAKSVRMSCCSHALLTVPQAASCLQVSDTTARPRKCSWVSVRSKNNNDALPPPASSWADSHLWRTKPSPHLFLSFSGAQRSDQGHIRCSPNAAPAPPLSGSHSGDGQWRGMPTRLGGGRGGEGESFFHPKQNKHCVLPQCNNLLGLVHRGSFSPPVE